MRKNETAVYLVLKEICVPSSIIGYTYIKEALLMLLESNEPPALLMVTKALYPQIAKNSIPRFPRLKERSDML